MIQDSDLLDLLPHRSPIRLLDGARMGDDRILLCHQRIPEREHPVLKHHFPDFPVWPGVLILEAMAQTTAIYLLSERGGLKSGEIPVFGAADTRFLKPVYPTESLHYRTSVVRLLGDNGLFSVTVSRGETAEAGQVVARARISAGIQNRASLPAPSPEPPQATGAG